MHRMSRDVQLQFENMKQDVASTELAGATIVAQASKASANEIAVEDGGLAPELG